MTKSVLAFILVFFFSEALAAQSGDTVRYGLEFRSYETAKELRTGLDLTSGKKIRIQNGSELCFDIMFRQGNRFGFVFRMIQENRSDGKYRNIDMVSNDNNASEIFSLTVNGQTAIRLTKEDTGILESGRWHSVSVRFGEKSVSMTIDGITRESYTETDLAGRYLIFFGSNDIPQFNTKDVPSMSVANISLNRKGKTTNRWDLSEHHGDMTPDVSGRMDATATNPVWLRDKHVFWDHIISMTVEGRPQTAFDEDTGRIFLAACDSMHVIDTRTETVRRMKVSGQPLNSKSNNMLWSCKDKELINYRLETGECTVFNPKTMSWDNYGSEPSPNPEFWHHNRCILKDGRIAVFGGYGFHLYHSTLRIFSPYERKFHADTTDFSGNVTPRYLSAMTQDNKGRLYIFGGYGSESGRQTESPKHLYDLYMADPESGTCTEIREFKPGKEQFVCGSSMIFSPDSSCLYALTYNGMINESKIQLKSIPLDPDGDIKDFGDAIPYYFHDTESYCDLYYDRPSRRLTAMTFHLTGPSRQYSEINIYTMDFPPLMTEEDAASVRDRIWWVLAGFLIISSMAVYIIRRSRSKETVKESEYVEIPQETVPVHNASIHLLGGFQVHDDAGNDITGCFTKTLKNLFLVILMETIKNGKGISSASLTELFWSDKDEESARNNRNVNIRKLRLIFSGTDGISISNRNRYWRADLDQDKISCDYLTALQLLAGMKKGSLQKDDRDRLLDLLSKGTLLVFTQEEWADGYKAGFSATVIDSITAMSKETDSSGNPELLIRIADVILLHDSIDEDAVRMKCRALARLGRNGLARKTYDAFRQEYERLMEQQPALTFGQAAGIE